MKDVSTIAMNGRMEKNTIIPFLMICLMVLVTCSGRKIDSSWQDIDPSIDGVSDDWNPDILKFDGDLNMVYGVSNNNDAVRFVVQFSDERMARKMDRNGFTIWIDKDENKGIRYVDESARDQMYERLLEGPAGPDRFREQPEEKIRSMLSGQFFLIEGKEETELRRLPDLNIRAAASVVSGRYCMEYQIPRSILTGDKTFQAGIEISGVDKSVREAFEKRMSEMRSGEGQRPEGGMGMDRPQGGRDGMRGGRMRNGTRSAERQESLRPDFEKQEFRIRIKLADKPE